MMVFYFSTECQDKFHLGALVMACIHVPSYVPKQFFDTEQSNLELDGTGEARCLRTDQGAARKTKVIFRGNRTWRRRNTSTLLVDGFKKGDAKMPISL